jgi:hypothetical protein
MLLPVDELKRISENSCEASCFFNNF